MFLAVIAGGVSGSFTFQLLGAGLRAPASPGSIIAILAMTPLNSVMSAVSVLAGIAVGATISFLVAAAILKADAKDTVDNFDEKVQEIHQAKQRSKRSGSRIVNRHSEDYFCLRCWYGFKCNGGFHFA